MHTGSLEDRLRFHGWTVTPTGCWEWNKGRNHGYGVLGYGGKTLLAHRAAYETWVGPIPDGKLVRHRCDNEPCINPAHLRLGTIADNMRDLAERGDPPRGSKHPLSKLSEEDVVQMRDQYGTGHSVADLARRYGVSARSVGRIVRGERWTHVGWPNV